MRKKYILILIFIAIFSLNTVCAEDLTNQSDDMLNGYEESILADDFVKVVGNDKAYEATFYDDCGENLYGARIPIEVNGVTYYRTTDSSGHVRLNINLMPGEYGIKTTNPATGESNTAFVNILPNIVENHDLTKYYRNASQYTVRLVNPNGNYESGRAPVVFNINGVFYTRYTNDWGYAKLNINLNPGEYIITAQNGIYQTSNIIKVLPTLYEYGEYRWNHPYVASEQPLLYRDGCYRVVALDGQGNLAPGAKVIFNINGVFYDRFASEAGVARLNINLNPGEYIITAYYNGFSASNKIIVVKNPLYYTIKGPLNNEYTNMEWSWSPQHQNYIRQVYDIYHNLGLELKNIGYYGEKYIAYDSATAMAYKLSENGNLISQVYIG